jgi:3-hydroxyisobutyrate dehydrogenase
MCGGTAEAFVRAKPVLAGMGNPDKIFHAGPSGSGQVAKAANNMLLAIHMIGTCEALAMGEANGLDPKVLSEIMKASSETTGRFRSTTRGPASWKTRPPAGITSRALWLI